MGSKEGTYYAPAYGVEDPLICQVRLSAMDSIVRSTGSTQLTVLKATQYPLWLRAMSELAAQWLDTVQESNATVSRICHAIKDEFGVWSARRLDNVMLDYLFLDASNFKMHPNSPAEPVRVLRLAGQLTAIRPPSPDEEG